MHRFEKDLKTKLSQKCPATQEEAAFLTKTFKFFDIQNQGSVTKDQFGRAITKVGVVLADGMVSILSLHHQPLTRRYVEQDLEMIFDYYDRSGDGRIDYKEFSAILQSGDGAQQQTPAQAMREYRQQ